MNNKFYDTCSLLILLDRAFDEFFYISSITLNELEDIKTSGKKDEDIKYKTRRLLHLLDDNQDKYLVYIYTNNLEYEITSRDIDITNDTRIMATYMKCNKEFPCTYVTNDLANKMIAKSIFGIENIESVEYDKDDYTGYIELIPSMYELADFYSNLNINIHGLLINQYLIVRTPDEFTQDDLYKWNGTEHERIISTAFESKMFGKVVPFKGDLYQILAMDSLVNNKITMIRGKAGSGKSYLSLGYLFYKLQRHEIDKIIIFCNSPAAAGSVKLGFYPGSKNSKLLDSQIGNFLTSKIGDKLEVERLINEGTILLLPMSDMRGFDTTGMKAGVYITEAQNMDIQLAKLVLQRVGEDSILVIDGDDRAQVDDYRFAGVNNGMKRISEVFKNHDFYGEVYLNKIHRSKIAELAEEL